MKIAIIAPSHKSFISSFLPEIDEKNLPEGYFGAPFIGDLIREILNSGHEVVAITTDPNLNNAIVEFTNGAFKWVVVPQRKHSFQFNKFAPGRMLDFFSVERKWMRKAVENNRPDFIHAHWGYEFAHVAVSSGIPYLVTLHDNPYKIFKHTKHIYRLFRLIYAEYLLPKLKFKSTVSPYMLKYASRGIGECRMIPNPVPIPMKLEEANDHIASRLLSIKHPSVVMIMNGWDKLKNGKSGLLAFQLFLNKFPNASLYLFGRGTELNGPAHKDVNELGLKNVSHYGMISRVELLDIVKDKHIMLHPALEESFGVALVEAMAMGIPVIGGMNSGAVGWVINQNELLTDVRNPNRICETLFKCIDDYKEFSIFAYKNAIERFAANKIANQYLEYYNYILNEGDN